MTGRRDQLAAPWPLVGRDEELALIERRVAHRFPGVLITGSAGSGKSRLAHEARLAAHRAGRATRTVACTRATAEIPYAALASFHHGPTEGDRFSEILAALRRESDPPVLCIDDIDRLDRRSMAVVQQAVSEGLVSLIATARSEGTADDDLVSLWKDFGVTRIEIQALSRHEVAAMVTAGLGGAVDAVALKSIWSTAAGVPLYVRELVLEAVTVDVLVRDHDVWMLAGSLPNPATLVDLVGLRIEHLSDDAREAAELIGVAELLPTALLCSLASSAAAMELEGVGVIESIGDQHRLTHPLFGEVIRAAMPSVRLHSVMARLADAIEEQGLDGDDDLMRVASWQLSSGSGGTPAVMNAAAHAAYRARDFDLAQRLASAASEHGEVEATLLLAQVLHEAGDHTAAERVNVGLEGSLADPAMIERAIVQRAVNLFFGLGRGAEALEVLSRDPDGAPFNRAWFLINMSRIDEARSAIPLDHDDHRSVIVTTAWADALGGRPDRAIGVLDRLAGAGERPSTAPSRFRDFPTIPRTLGLIETGRLAEALDVATTGHDASVDHHPDFIRAWWLFLLARIHHDAGRLVTAASLFRQGEGLQARLQQPGLMRWFAGGAAWALVQTSDVSDVDTLLTTCDDLANRDEQAFAFLVDGARGWQRWRRGDHGGAIDDLIATGDRSAEIGAQAAAGRLWFEAARLGGARRLDGRLDGDRTDLGTARSSFVAGLVESDPRTMAEAAELFDDFGGSLWAAEAWTIASRLADADGDRRRANAARRRAAASRGRCESVDTPGLVAEREAVPLTDREREVVTMAARGVASKEIAEQLFVSLRTVNNLIQRAYGKLGVSSRAGAAEALGIDSPT